MNKFLIVLLTVWFLELTIPVLAISSNTTLLDEWLMSGRTLDNAKYTPSNGVKSLDKVIVSNFTYGYKSRPLYAGPVFHIGSDLYVVGIDTNNGAGHDGYVYLINVSNMEQVANFSHGQYLISPISVAGDYLYFGGGNVNPAVYQLDFSLRQISKFSSVFYPEGSPYIVNDYLYIGDTGGGGPGVLFQLDAYNISRQIANFTASDEVSGGVLVYDGYSFFGSYNDYVYQVNASNVSQQISNFSVAGDVFSQPVYANGWIYVTTSTASGHVYQLNATNLSSPYKSFYISGGAFASPAYWNNYIYVVTKNGLVYQLNASNVSQQIANFTLYASAYASPVVNDYFVYVMDNNGTLYQFDNRNVSNLLSYYDLGENGVSQPVLIDGTLFAGTEYHLWKLTYNDTVFVNDCMNITEEGTYFLESDVSSEGTCYNIMSDNVVLDCQDHVIYSDGYNYLININSSENVVIRNCNLQYGNVYLQGDSQVSVVHDYLSVNVSSADCWLGYYHSYFKDGDYNICPGSYYVHLNDASDIFMQTDGNVVLNGTGVSVVGDYVGTYLGSVMSGSASFNNSVYGFNITGMGIGMIVYSQGGVYKDILLDGNLIGMIIYGTFIVQGSKNIVLDGVSAVDNYRGAVMAFFVSNISVINGVYANNGFGIQSIDSYMFGNNFSWGYAGVSDGVFDHNSFINNRNVGLGIIGSSNRIVNNNISDNVGFGLISVNNGGLCNISGNYINYNKMTGLLVAGGGNVVEGNEIIANGDGVTLVDNDTLNFVLSGLFSMNVSDMFGVEDLIWWNGVVSVIRGDKDIFSNNLVLDNYNFGMLFALNSSDADLYSNFICNNSRSGFGQVAINSRDVVVNANTTDPYNNVFCLNNPSWVDVFNVLELFFTPIDAGVSVVGYLTGLNKTPFMLSPGAAVYVLPLFSFYNDSVILGAPYQWSVFREGYDTRFGLVDMNENVVVVVDLNKQSLFVCSSNSTSKICQIMSESGAGFGLFIEYLGPALFLFLIMLILIMIIAIIAYNVVEIVRR